MHPVRFPRPGPRAGFTLIEMMVTVAVLAILSAIAYPSYTDYVRRGALPEAFGALADYRVKMEQYFQDFRNYGSGGRCADDERAPGWNNFAPAGARNFTYACTSTAGGYTLTAIGKSGSRAQGHVYTVDESNTQRTTQFMGKEVDRNCWLAKGSEC